MLTKDYACGSAVLAELDDKLIEIPPPSKMEDRPMQMPPRLAGGYNIGFVGRFVSEKGIDVVLDAIGPVVQRLPNTRFFFRR